MQYLAWRGLHDRVEILFLLVGHTKFAPDWCFGLFKQKFRRTKVTDIARVVNESAVANYAQLVGTEDGKMIVPQYNWADHFACFFKRNAFAGIKSLRHLVFSSAEPGVAIVRDQPGSAERKLELLAKEHLNWSPTSAELPPLKHPEGLSRKYLFDKIREFCPPHCQDIVCPDPAAPLLHLLLSLLPLLLLSLLPLLQLSLLPLLQLSLIPLLLYCHSSHCSYCHSSHCSYGHSSNFYSPHCPLT